MGLPAPAPAPSFGFLVPAHAQPTASLLPGVLPPRPPSPGSLPSLGGTAMPSGQVPCVSTLQDPQLPCLWVPRQRRVSHKYKVLVQCPFPSKHYMNGGCLLLGPPHTYMSTVYLQPPSSPSTTSWPPPPTWAEYGFSFPFPGIPIAETGQLRPRDIAQPAQRYKVLTVQATCTSFTASAPSLPQTRRGRSGHRFLSKESQH